MIPEILRPRGLPHREFTPGLDLPSTFWNNLKAIDQHLYLVWHPYRITYDDVMNQYTGALDDPRFSISLYAGEEVWGFVLTDNVGLPILENKWHIWRLCWPHGWCHVAPIKSHDPAYLTLLIDRLHIQANFRIRYGDHKWNEKLSDDQRKEMEKNQKQTQDLFGAVQEENSWLMKKVMDNLERGITKPTNPTHESIISYPGQVNRTKIERPLQDEEGGLIIPGK